MSYLSQPGEKSRLLSKLLQLKRRPIAISLNKKPPPDLPKLVGKMEFCKMWTKALEGEAFFATPENHDCLTGEHYLGFRDWTDKEAVCRFLVDQVHGFRSHEVFEKYITKFPMFKPGQVQTICIAPLEKISFEPDIILVVCNPEQAMLLLWTYSYNTGEPVLGATGTAMCRTLVIEPYLSGKPSFTIGDPGGRYIIGLKSGEITASIPYRQFDLMLTTLDSRINDWKA